MPHHYYIQLCEKNKEILNLSLLLLQLPDIAVVLSDGAV